MFLTTQTSSFIVRECIAIPAITMELDTPDSIETAYAYTHPNNIHHADPSGKYLTHHRIEFL